MVRVPKSVLRFLRPMNYYRFFLWRAKVLQIFIQSRSINRKLVALGKKGLFLDCGSNVGQGFEFFRRYYPNRIYDYILFEPNPYCFEVLKERYASQEEDGVHLKNVAIGIEDTNVNFYGIEDEKGGIYSVGGTVLPEHNSKKFTAPNFASLKVSSINFADFLLKELKKNDYPVVILKLDIEGGEYLVLNSLISNELLSLFETIYVEFHSQYMSSKYADDYRNRERVFLKYAKRTRTRVIRWI